MIAHHLATHSFATAADRVDQMMHFVAAIRAAADGLVFIANHAVHAAARPAAESALGLLLVWLLIKLRIPGRFLARRSQIKVVRIDPPAESAFRPEAFPDRFGGPEDARVFCMRFFPWYNDEHRHSGVGFHTPADVHYGRAPVLREQRAGVLTAAYTIHPERFVRKPPEPPRLPVATWINKPQEEVTTAQ